MSPAHCWHCPPDTHPSSPPAPCLPGSLLLGWATARGSEGWAPASPCLCSSLCWGMLQEPLCFGELRGSSSMLFSQSFCPCSLLSVSWAREEVDGTRRGSGRRRALGTWSWEATCGAGPQSSASCFGPFWFNLAVALFRWELSALDRLACVCCLRALPARARSHQQRPRRAAQPRAAGSSSCSPAPARGSRLPHPAVPGLLIYPLGYQRKRLLATHWWQPGTFATQRIGDDEAGMGALWPIAPPAPSLCLLLCPLPGGTVPPDTRPSEMGSGFSCGGVIRGNLVSSGADCNSINESIRGPRPVPGI